MRSYNSHALDAQPHLSLLDKITMDDVVFSHLVGCEHSVDYIRRRALPTLVQPRLLGHSKFLHAVNEVIYTKLISKPLHLLQNLFPSEVPKTS